jgi:hypothetical protein
LAFFSSFSAAGDSSGGSPWSTTARRATRGRPAVGEQPVAEDGGVGVDVRELVELKLYEHEQVVQPLAVGEDRGARAEPPLDGVERGAVKAADAERVNRRWLGTGRLASGAR